MVVDYNLMAYRLGTLTDSYTRPEIEAIIASVLGKKSNIYVSRIITLLRKNSCIERSKCLYSFTAYISPKILEDTLNTVREERRIYNRNYYKKLREKANKFDYHTLEQDSWVEKTIRENYFRNLTDDQFYDALHTILKNANYYGDQEH